MELQLVYRAFFILFCAAIFMYHITCLFSQYFAYETKIDIEIDEPPEMNLPAVSICFNMIDIITVDKLFLNYPKWREIVTSAQVLLTGEDIAYYNKYVNSLQDPRDHL